MGLRCMISVFMLTESKVADKMENSCKMKVAYPKKLLE